MQDIYGYTLLRPVAGKKHMAITNERSLLFFNLQSKANNP